MRRTSTQLSRQLSDLKPGRKPTAAVRITRRVRGYKFGKWLTKRLRRVVRHPRRQKQGFSRRQELTEENLRRIDDAEAANIRRSGKAARFADGKLRKKKKSYNKKGDAGGVRLKHDADLLRTRADMAEMKDAADEFGEMDGTGGLNGRERGAEDVVMLPNGRVIAPASKHASPAAAKNETIGRRAAAWFKEQTGSVRDSVDLTRFLLREMKCELQAAV